MPAHPHPQISGTRDWTNYLLDVSRGLVPGAEYFSGYGRRTTAGAESNVLWPGTLYSIPPASGIQLSLVSTSASDSPAGTGIRTIEIHYLDTNLDSQLETLALNGLTPVLTVAVNIRFVQCIHVVTAGTAKVAIGTINASSGGVIYAQIAIGANRCTSSVRMVPGKKRLFISAIAGGSSSGSAGASSILQLATTGFEGHDTTNAGIFIPITAATLQDNATSLVLTPPIPFEPGTAVGMTFETDKAATVVGSWFGWIEPI